MALFEMRSLAFGALCLSLALSGCTRADRSDAKLLAKASIDSTTKLAEFQGKVASDYSSFLSTRTILSGVAPDSKGQREDARLLAGLREQANLANKLKDLATKSSEVLYFGSADAKAAARDLVDQVAKVNNHPFGYPSAVKPFVPAEYSDPNTALDRAVTAFVEAQALKHYRSALPKFHEAIRAMNAYVAAISDVGNYYRVTKLSNDYRVIERALDDEVVIQTSLVKSSFDTFGIEYHPSALKENSDLASGVKAALDPRLNELAAAAISEGHQVVTQMYRLERSVAKMANISGGYPYLTSGHFSSEKVEDLSKELLSHLSKKPQSGGAQAPRTKGNLRVEVLRRMASRLTEPEQNALRRDKRRRAAILAKIFNEAIDGPAFVTLPQGIYDTPGPIKSEETKKLTDEEAKQKEAKEETPVMDYGPSQDEVPSEYANRLWFLSFLGSERNIRIEENGLGVTKMTRRRYIVVPLAGFNLAEANREVLARLFDLGAK